MNKLIKPRHSLQQNTSLIHNSIQCPCSQYIVVSQSYDSISRTRKYFLQLFYYLIKNLINLPVHNTPRRSACFPELYWMKNYACLFHFISMLLEIIFFLSRFNTQKKTEYSTSISWLFAVFWDLSSIKIGVQNFHPFAVHRPMFAKIPQGLISAYSVMQLHLLSELHIYSSLFSFTVCNHSS